MISRSKSSSCALETVIAIIQHAFYGVMSGRCTSTRYPNDVTSPQRKDVVWERSGILPCSQQLYLSMLVTKDQATGCESSASSECRSHPLSLSIVGTVPIATNDPMLLGPSPSSSLPVRPFSTNSFSVCDNFILLAFQTDFLRPFCGFLCRPCLHSLLVVAVGVFWWHGSAPAFLISAGSAVPSLPLYIKN